MSESAPAWFRRALATPRTDHTVAVEGTDLASKSLVDIIREGGATFNNAAQVAAIADAKGRCRYVHLPYAVWFGYGMRCETESK